MLSDNWLLIKEFLTIISVAMLIALPVTYFLFGDWLENYAFHIAIPYEGFVFVASLFMLGIALLAVFQIPKALRINPVEHLKE